MISYQIEKNSKLDYTLCVRIYRNALILSDAGLFLCQPNRKQCRNQGDDRENDTNPQGQCERHCRQQQPAE